MNLIDPKAPLRQSLQRRLSSMSKLSIKGEQQFHRKSKISKFMENINTRVVKMHSDMSKIFLAVDFKRSYDSLLELLNFYYEASVNLFEAYEEQIQELEMLKGGDNSETKFTVEQMIKDLLSDKEKELSSNKEMLEENLNSVVEDAYNLSTTSNEYTEKEKEKFINDVINLINNLD